MKGRKQAALAALLALVLGTGCNGFPKSEPIQQAETKPEKYPTYTPSAAPAQTQTAAPAAPVQHH